MFSLPRLIVMVNSQFFRQSTPPSPPLCRRLLNYKRRDLIWSGSWTMDNAVSRLDNGELKQGVGFVMRRHTSFTLPHAPQPLATCHLPLPCWPKCALELPNKFFCYLIVTKLFPHAFCVHCSLRLLPLAAATARGRSLRSLSRIQVYKFSS